MVSVREHYLTFHFTTVDEMLWIIRMQSNYHEIEKLHKENVITAEGKKSKNSLALLQVPLI